MIKRILSNVYFRRLIVRAIEDAVVLGGMCLGIAGICHVVGGIFDKLGVL
jgi:hypothetical protein